MRDAVNVDVDKWFGQQAVYRISMGNFLFFMTMSLVMMGVKYRGDKRDRMLHHGHPLAKLGLWLLFILLPFFFSVPVLNAYGVLARFGSGLFLVVQMVILLDFVQIWNDAWVESAEDDPRWLYALLSATLGAYVGCLVLVILMFLWFTPLGLSACSFNSGLATGTLLLVLTVSALALMPVSRKGSLFPASCVALYCTYLCFSALQSEPKDYACNGPAHRLSAANGSALVMGMLTTLVSVVYAAFRAGSNTSLFTLEGSEEGDFGGESQVRLLEEGSGSGSAGLDGLPCPPEGFSREEAREVHSSSSSSAADAAAASASGSSRDMFIPVAYNYSFFHLIFALASMYIAMLMTGWGTVAQEKDRIDVGWTSVWVKIGAQATTGVLYCWTLVAPALFPDRDFS